MNEPMLTPATRSTRQPGVEQHVEHAEVREAASAAAARAPRRSPAPSSRRAVRATSAGAARPSPIANTAGGSSAAIQRRRAGSLPRLGAVGEAGPPPCTPLDRRVAPGRRACAGSRASTATRIRSARASANSSQPPLPAARHSRSGSPARGPARSARRAARIATAPRHGVAAAHPCSSPGRSTATRPQAHIAQLSSSASSSSGTLGESAHSAIVTGRARRRERDRAAGLQLVAQRRARG